MKMEPTGPLERRTQTTDVPRIIRNDDGVYEDNLVHYARVIFHHATNLAHPYHNFRHTFHIMWLGYDACGYYRDVMTPRDMRKLLIGALMHDFDHTGKAGDDAVNIARSIEGLRKYAAPQDRPYLDDIEKFIHGTQYPYVVDVAMLDLCGKIIRDADVSQAFSVAWIQQVIFGLAAEWGMTPLEALRKQEPFLKALRYNTEWAKKKFPEQLIGAKIDEARELLELLEPAP